MPAKVPAGRKATGAIAAAFAEEPWLYSYDLPDDRDTPVKIEEVRQWDQLDLAGTKHRNVFGLKFVGKKKILLLTSKATFKAMAKLHGKTFEGWVGKEISLYVDEVDAFGQTVDAIRIRTPGRGRSQAARAAGEFLDTGDPGPSAPPPGIDAGPARPAAGTTAPSLDLDGDDFDGAVSALDLTAEEAGAVLAEHGGDRAKAAKALSRRVDQLNARQT